MATSTSASTSTLLSELDLLFQQDPDIDEYALVPGEAMGSQSFMSSDHKLAISVLVLPQLVAEARGMMSSGTDLPSATRALVLVNGDNYTVWNQRKKIVAAGALDAEAEIRLTTLVFRWVYSSYGA